MQILVRRWESHGFKPNAKVFPHKVSSKMTLHLKTPSNWSDSWLRVQGSEPPLVYDHEILTRIPPVADFEGTNGDLDIEAERVMVGAKHDDDISQVKVTNIKRIK